MDDNRIRVENNRDALAARSRSHCGLTKERCSDLEIIKVVAWENMMERAENRPVRKRSGLIEMGKGVLLLMPLCVCVVKKEELLHCFRLESFQKTFF